MNTHSVLICKITEQFNRWKLNQWGHPCSKDEHCCGSDWEHTLLWGETDTYINIGLSLFTCFARIVQLKEGISVKGGFSSLLHGPCINKLIILEWIGLNEILSRGRNIHFVLLFWFQRLFSTKIQMFGSFKWIFCDRYLCRFNVKSIFKCYFIPLGKSNLNQS